MDKNEDAPEPRRLKSVGEWAKLPDYNTMQEQEIPETPSARQQALNDLEETIAELVEAEGETPSALSAAPESTAHLYVTKAQYDAKIAKMNAENADLREKLSTAERELAEFRLDKEHLQKSVLRGLAEKEAAEAELARRTDALEKIINACKGDSVTDAGWIKHVAEAALQEREGKGE